MHPNQGWQQQPQGYGPPPPQGYGPPQGPPGYGPQPGWGPPRPPSIVPAFLAGGMWLLVAVLCFVMAGMNSADGKGIRQNPEVATGLLGLAFGRGLVGNGDAAIAATYSAGGVLLLLTALVMARLGFARWILAGLGVLVVCYYVFAVIRLAINSAPFEFIIMPIVALLLWLVATIISVLPAVGRAMRKFGPSHQPQPPVNRW